MARKPPRIRPIGDLEDDRPLHKLEIQGEWLKWKVAAPPPPARPPSPRGKIMQFSDAARLRMLCLFNQLDWPKIKEVKFLTLTVPDDVDIRDYHVHKRHRSEFWRRLETFAGMPTAAIWRQEWEIRKSGQHEGKLWPHYHILLFREKTLPKLEVAEWWSKSLGVASARTRIEAVRDKEKSRRYVSWYTAKVCGPLSLSLLHGDASWGGRQWGIFRKECLPFAEAFTYESDEDLRMNALHTYILDGASPVNKWGSASFTKFGPKAVEAKAILFDIGLDG